MQACSGHDTYAYAVVPEIRIQTYVQACGKHFRHARFAIGGHLGAVEQIAQTGGDGIHQDGGGEVVVRIAVCRIVIIHQAGTVEDGIYRALVFAASRPIDEAQINDGGADLQLLDRFVCETEIKCCSITGGS